MFMVYKPVYIHLHIQYSEETSTLVYRFTLKGLFDNSAILNYVYEKGVSFLLFLWFFIIFGFGVFFLCWIFAYKFLVYAFHFILWIWFFAFLSFFGYGLCFFFVLWFWFLLLFHSLVLAYASFSFFGFGLL